MKAMKNTLLLAAVAAGLATVGVANAGTITGTLNLPPVSSSGSPINLSAGAADWTYYGLTGDTSQDTKSGGPNSFSAPSSTGQGQGTDSQDYISFTGGTPNSSATASQNFALGYGAGQTISFTQTLLAPTETLNIYLVSYDAQSNISATLSSGGSFTDNAAVLPYNPQGDDPNNNGAGHGYGLLTLNVSGATGDILTFSDTTVNAGAYDNVGIQAASVSTAAVPEPASLALLGAGALGLLLIGRKRSTT